MAKVKPFTLDRKYGALLTLTTILQVIAAVLVLAGIVGAVSGNAFGFGLLVGCVAGAFMFIVQAQLITVVIDLEWNQRETNGLIEQMIEALPTEDEGETLSGFSQPEKR